MLFDQEGDLRAKDRVWCNLGPTLTQLTLRNEKACLISEVRTTTCTRSHLQRYLLIYKLWTVNYSLAYIITGLASFNILNVYHQHIFIHNILMFITLYNSVITLCTVPFLIVHEPSPLTFNMRYAYLFNTFDHKYLNGKYGMYHWTCCMGLSNTKTDILNINLLIWLFVCNHDNKIFDVCNRCSWVQIYTSRQHKYPSHCWVIQWHTVTITSKSTDFTNKMCCFGDCTTTFNSSYFKLTPCLEIST